MADRRSSAEPAGGERSGRSGRPRRRKRRFDPAEKLPTPPPDPRHPAAKRQSLGPEPGSAPATPGPGPAAGFAGTEEAFRHLDRLHSVLEQILELRHKNARLFRRVRELERLKASRRLEESTRRAFLRPGGPEPALPEDEDSRFAESLLGAVLEAAAGRASASPGPEEPARPALARQRSRSISADSRPLASAGSSKRSSCHLAYGKPGKRHSLAGALGIVPPKVSKWTKVKAAFRWERASMGTAALSSVVAEAMEQDAAKYLRPPEGPDAAASTTTLSGSSPRTADNSGPPSPGTLSSSSSVDDVYGGGYNRTFTSRSAKRSSEENQGQRSRSLEGEVIIPQNILCATQNSRDGVSRRLEKIPKTPWGMVKEIISSRRDNVRRPLPRTSIRSEDGYSLSSHGSSDMIHEMLTPEHSARPRIQVTATSEGSLAVPASKPSSPSGRSAEVVDLASRRLTPTLTITVPSSEELRSVSSPESASPHQQLDSNSTDEGRSPSEELDSSSSAKCRPGASPAPRERAQPGPARLQRQDSKWNKVKRAFLTSASSVPPSPSRVSSFFDETDGGGSYSASAEDLDNNGGVSPTMQADIQRNYQILHDKLSMEFHRKLTEWDKLKNGQTSGSNRSSRLVTSPKDKDSANALLMGEEQLTPEFKKKLQEWKRIKKGNPSGSTSPEQQVSRRRLTDWQIWRTTAKSEGKTDSDASGKMHLSEDFLKKMDEWKKIKSARSDEEQSAGGRRNSAEISQIHNTSRRWKQMDEKEFQPLDKIIAMIEREQQRVEKHREKLLDTMPRTNKLSRIVDLTPEKREVLVYTSTGFYRFEGISQEFTKKLYEWEKSQGIAPELSTLQLLNPSNKVLKNDTSAKSLHKIGSKSLKRSKSMSSVVESSVHETTPIRQPSSLSLNDVENLENEEKLRIDSKQTIGEEEMSEELAIDDSEPEAVIVDIEDVIEETASPMAKFQPQQTPVYCVTSSETTSIAIPLGTVTASHEPSPVILIQPGETHHPRVEKNRFTQLYNENDHDKNVSEIHLDNDHFGAEKDTYENNDVIIDEHRKRLFEPTEIKICETIIEEEMSSSLQEGESNSEVETSSVKTEDDIESLKEVEVKKNVTLSILPASNSKPNQGNQVSTENGEFESKQTFLPPRFDSSASGISDEHLPKDKLSKVTNYEDNAKVSSTEIKHQILDDLPETDKSSNANANINDAVIIVSNDLRPKKILKTRRLTDTQVGYKWQQSSRTIEEISSEPTDSLTVSTYPETPNIEKIIINESTLNKIIVPTASNEQLSNIVPSSDLKMSNDSTVTEAEEPHCRRLNIKSESKSVFVKTKRMIFSPFSRRNSKDKTIISQKDESDNSETASKESIESPSTSLKHETLKISTFPKLPDIQRSKSSSECPIASVHRPPLPQSPVLSRKEYRRSSPKETAPSIRMMIQRYNQKLQEDASSPASSGSGSPIWRSPTSERRVRTQMERYQEEVQRAVSGSPRSRVEEFQKRLEKSASAGIIQSSPTAVGSKNVKGEILKSTSADFIRNASLLKQKSKTSVNSTLVDQIKEDVHNEDDKRVLEKRKNSLKNAEIFTNIKQSLVQEYKTLAIKTESTEDSKTSVLTAKSPKHNDNEVVREKKMKKLPGKISPDLIHKLNALTSATNQKHKRFYSNSESADSQTTASENSTPLRVRAQRIKKAKDDFFSRGPSCYSHDASIETYQCTQNSPALELNGNMDFIKSASAGMINVDTRTFQRLSTSQTDNEEPLLRTEKACTEIAGTFSKIANKFRRAKFKRGKDKDGKMSTVSMLCRQSLLVDIQAAEMSKSCPTSPSPQRDEDETSRFKQHRESH